MRCAVCDKESNNRRVCPYCFTPYPSEAAEQRGGAGAARPSTGAVRPSAGSARQGGAAAAPAGGIGAVLASVRGFVRRQSPTVRWSGAGILVVLLLWLVTPSPADEGPVPGGPSAPSTLQPTPEEREEALALLKATRESALVETQGDEVFVSYPAASFPLDEAGQLELARQFARADEIAEGRKRRIFFHNPTGRLFAQSDGVTGVTVSRQ